MHNLALSTNKYFNQLLQNAQLSEVCRNVHDCPAQLLRLFTDLELEARVLLIHLKGEQDGFDLGLPGSHVDWVPAILVFQVGIDVVFDEDMTHFLFNCGILQILGGFCRRSGTVDATESCRCYRYSTILWQGIYPGAPCPFTASRGEWSCSK